MRGWQVLAAVTPGMVGAAALLGWAFGIESLKSVQAGLTVMNPVTALALLAVALATLLHLQRKELAARALGLIVAAVGAAKILDLALGGVPVDLLLFSTEISANSAGPGRMAPNTAAALLLLGTGIAMTDRTGRFWVVSQLLASVVALLALFAMIGYCFGVAPLHTIAALRPMAVHTAAALCISAVAQIYMQPRGLMAVLRDAGPAGTLARTVLPLAVLIPIAIGAAGLWGQTAGHYGTEAGVSIQVVANVTLTCGFLMIAIFMVHRSDQARLDRETALSRSQEVAHLGHVRWGGNGSRLIWSPEVFRIHGLSPATVAPDLAHWPSLFHSDDRDSFGQYLGQATTSSEMGEWRGRIVRPGGETRFASIRLTREKDARGGHGGVFGIVSDVTDLELAHREAETALTAKASFLANMSHEIRTPLNGILGFSELLMTSNLEPEQREQAQTVHQSARSLVKLLNDILDFSKIEAGQMDIELEPTNLPHLLKQCLSLVEAAARGKGLNIHLHIDETLPRYALVDGLRLRQIALNLLGNAIKFTGSGFVSLEARRVERGGADRLVLKVEDSGIGIHPDRKQSIFSDFVQADPTISKRFGGTGLGLSISRRLAELLGGTIMLESEFGCGTTVELDIPLVAAAEPRDTPGQTGPLPLATSARILLVEDMDVNQKLATVMLQRLGHQVDLARDGREAVDKMQVLEAGETEFDLVLMDIQLPLLDGLEATRRIRALGPRSRAVSIIGLSANAFASDVSACLQAGMNDHLAKPFTMDDLSRTIARWLPAPGVVGTEKADEPFGNAERLFARHCVGAAELLTRLREALADGLGAEMDEVAAEVQRTSHNLAGTAASFGLDHLGEVAADVEHQLKQLRANESPEDRHEMIISLTDRLSAALTKRAA